MNDIILSLEHTTPEELFENHEHRAKAVVNAYLAEINPTVRYLKSDIMSEAMMALWKCCQRFKENTNNTFWTFAYLRVKGSITDYLRREKLQVRGDRIDSQITVVPLLPELHERMCRSRRKSDLGNLERHSYRDSWETPTWEYLKRNHDANDVKFQKYR